jgi:hypothetical protein
LAALLGFGIVMGAIYYYSAYRKSRLTVIQVDTTILDGIKDEKLMHSLFKMSCEIFAGS